MPAIGPTLSAFVYREGNQSNNRGRTSNQYGDLFDLLSARNETTREEL